MRKKANNQESYIILGDNYGFMIILKKLKGYYKITGQISIVQWNDFTTWYENLKKLISAGEKKWCCP